MASLQTKSSIKKVLVAEDDLNLGKVLASGVAAMGFEVANAFDGEEAVTKTVDKVPNLVLLDLLLPKLDGFKYLDRIRHYPNKAIAGVKVIVLSNLWSNKDILRAQALTIDAYYVKSDTKLEDVYAKIKEILAK